MPTPWLPSPNPTKPKKAGTVDTTIPDYFGRTPQATDVLRPINLPKIPGADPFIWQQFQDAAALRDRLSGDVADFRNLIGTTQPAVADFSRQEISDVDRLFNPTGYEAELAGIRGRRAKAMAGLDDTILADLRRALNLQARGGTAGTGLGSYLSRQAAAEAARIRAAEPYDAAAQERADLAALMAARQGAIGKRQAITDSLLARLLSPTEKDIASQSASASALQQAINSALANLVQAWGLQAY